MCGGGQGSSVCVGFTRTWFRLGLTRHAGAREARALVGRRGDGGGESQAAAACGQCPTAGPLQYELFPQQDRCPLCGARLITKTDGYGQVYELCRKCRHRSYLQR